MCNFKNETSTAIQAVFFNKTQWNTIKECRSNFNIETDINFTIQRKKSRHRSKIVFWRIDLKEEAEFDFSKTYSEKFSESTALVFDGKNLTCRNQEMYLTEKKEECNGLPLDDPVPIIMLSLELNPREAEFFDPNENEKWTKNKYSLQGNYYGVKCTGNSEGPQSLLTII